MRNSLSIEAYCFDTSLQHHFTAQTARAIEYILALPSDGKSVVGETGAERHVFLFFETTKEMSAIISRMRALDEQV